MAIGHEILRIVYHMLKNGTHYKELGATYRDERRKKAQIKHYTEQLRNLGVEVPEIQQAG
ncbi:MAG: hypothetical protein HUK20_09685 [Fibrobacter sp.]|nr:hypothetical protein [Fibrobacter sp.]